MARRTVVLEDPQRLLNGRCAVMTPVTDRDLWRYREIWKGVDALAHGQLVEEVNHFGRHRTMLDDVLVIEDLENQVICWVRVLEIRMMLRSRLTQAEIEELGYPSDEALSERIGVGERRMWFVRVFPLPAYQGASSH